MEQDIRDATRLLIVDPKAEEADRIVNIFRDAGQVTRAHHIVSIDSLESAFLEKQKWDLLIVSQLPNELTLSSLLESIEHQNRDIPIIMLIDYKDHSERLEYLKKGVHRVVSPKNESMLLLLANREIENLYVRRNYRRMSVVLNEAEKQRRMLLDDRVDAFVYIRDGIIRYVNPAFNSLVGADESVSFIGKYFISLIKESEHDDVGSFLFNLEETGQVVSVFQCSFVLDNGEELPVQAIAKPTSFDGSFTLSLQVKLLETSASSQNVNKELKESTVKFLSKKELVEQLNINHQKVVSGKGESTLVHASIDGLGEVHEGKGSLYSQKIESEIEQRIHRTLDQEHLRSNLGGGQYLLLINAGGETAIQEIAQDILDAVSEKELLVDGKSFNLSLSMGAVVLCDTGKDAQTLLVRAQHACKQAEKEGGNKLSFYRNRRVDVVKSVEKHIAMMLSQAMKTNAMQLYYQPIVSLKESEGEYYEVLFTMTDIRGREHDAVNFRPKLDNQTLWRSVDRWQLIEASKDLVKKRQGGSDTRLVFHLGGCAVNDEQFFSWLDEMLKVAKLPATAITLELSETNVVRYGEPASTFFESAKEKGYLTSISEFGCSVNPLENIESMPIDFVKIDNSFTKELISDNKNEEFEAVLQELIKKEKKIIIPHVQNTKALAPLWHLGVDYVQGNFLQGPASDMNYNFDSDF